MKKSIWIFGGLALLLAYISLPRTSLKPHSFFKTPPPPGNASPAARGATQLLAMQAVQNGALTAPAAALPASGPATPVPPPPVADVPAPFASFEAWAKAFVDNPAAPVPATLDEGKRLALARREALIEEIKSNPQAALGHAVPWRWRQALPPEIAAYLEEVVVGRGSYAVYCALPMPGAECRHSGGEMMRYVTMFGSGRTYSAYVYGHRASQMGQENIAVNGIAVGTFLALHEDPARVLEADEAAALQASTTRTVPTVCSACGAASAGGGVILDYGGQHLRACGLSHAAELNTTLAAAESARRSVTLASGGGSPAGGNSVWTNPPPENPVNTFGTKRVLFMRVIFPDDTRVPITESEAEQVMEEVNNFYVEASYNKANLITTVTPVLMLPFPKLDYSAEGPGALMSDAIAAAWEAGYVADNYDFFLLRHQNVPGFTWGGLGGGNGRSGAVWLQGTGVGLIAHELGHVFGLGHANFYETRRPALPNNPNNNPFDIDSLVGHDSVTGVGDDVAYGDVYDVMGSGGGEGPVNTNQQVSSFSGHFNTIGKSRLGWLPEPNIVTGVSGTTNRIYVHDTPRLVEGRSYALKVEKDAQRTYWVSARGKINAPWETNGVELHWAGWQQCLGYSHLLDTTPGTKDGSYDAAIALGRTYGDEESKIYITPVAKGGGSTNAWYDVVYYQGVATNNVAPEVEFTASTNVVDLDGTVTFRVTATDANSDALAYYWAFSDGVVAPSSPTVTRTFRQTGDIAVRVEVSDMKGGKTSKHLVVTVGRPATLRISGFVIDPTGQSVRDVRVSNGSLTESPYNFADDYQATYTDSDGAFSLVGLTNRTYPIGAFLEGYVTRPLNFDTSITLADKDAEGVLFRATPRTVVTAKRIKDAVTTSGSAGIFELARTGDTNTALQAYFLFGGTAKAGKDFTDWTNVVDQTNITPNPFGPVTASYKFYAIDFPTGIVSTQIMINPSPATNSDEKTVALTLMYPLEFMRVTVTNGETEGTLTNITNFVMYSDWELRSINGVDTWFQNYADYLPAFPGEARLALKGTPPSQPTISVLALVPNATENQNDAGLFTITRSGLSSSATTVAFHLSGTATAGSDYKELSGTIVIPAGASFVNVPVIALEDLYLEGNEEVILTIDPDRSYAVGNASAKITIIDNDMPSVTISATDGVASEAGGDTGAFVVTRQGDMNRALTVYYQATGSAVSGRDYRALPGSIIIPAGQPSAVIAVTPRDNGFSDGGNTLELRLADNPNYNIGTPNTARLHILDRIVPVVTVAATQGTAGESGAAGEFSVTRTGDVSRDLVVRFKMGGTARPFADYASLGTSVRIPAGSTRATLSLIPVDDRLREDPEYVILELVPGAEYTLGPNWQAMVDLNDEDSGALPAVGFNFLTSSGPEASDTAYVAVSVSANPAEDSPVTVLYKITGGTAISDIDYPATATTGQVVFIGLPPDAPEDERWLNRTQLIPLPILDNTNIQPNRSIVLTLLEPPSWTTNWLSTNDITITNDLGEVITTNQVVTNTMIVGVPMNALFDLYNSHAFTILDDDAATITVETLEPIAMEEGIQPGLFRITRLGSTNNAQPVRLQMGGFASNGRDYQPIPSTVEIPAGEYFVDVPVIPVDDPTQEFMENVTLALISAPGAQIGEAYSASLEIIDNDGTIEFTQTAYSASENAGVVNIAIRRTGYTNAALSVDYAVLPGTATAGTDFVATNGTVTFAPGEILRHVPVTVIDNEGVEPDETVQLLLRNLTGGAPIGGQVYATLTIRDDDAALEFTQASYRVNENGTNAIIGVRRLGVLNKLATLSFTATNGTAVSGVDFVGTNTLVALAAGVSNATVAVRILDNILIESNRTVQLMLETNAMTTGSVGPQGTALLEIADDDCALEFAAADYNVDESARTVALTVRRVGGTVNAVSVDFATTNGTAMATVDYEAVKGTLRFAGDTNLLAQGGTGELIFQPGETNQQLLVRIIDNNSGEGNRAFGVVLGNPKGPARGVLPGSTTLGAQTNAAVTIIDDELPGSVDFAFNPGLGADGPVHAVAVQPDGKIVLGGEFATVDGITITRIARLHDDGYLDSFFSPGTGPSATVHAVAVQPDGRILLGGAFTTYDGARAIRIARLNADATLDSAFDAGLGADRLVRAVAVGANGTVVLGGDFQMVDGQSRVGVARLLMDGTVDPAFDPGSGPLGDVYAVAVQADGRVLIGGNFTGVGTSRYSFVARLNADGTVDKDFNTGQGPDELVRSIAVAENGKIVIGGAFTKFNGLTRNGIARLNADGSLDTSFDPGAGADNTVFSVGVQPDGKVLLAGAFTQVNGAPLNRYARLNPNGMVDDGYLIFQGANGLVRSLAVQPDTALVIGGDFTTANGLARRGIARIHGDEKFVLNKIQFAAATYRVLETAGSATVTVVRSGDLTASATVDFATSGGTAVAGVNYQPTNGTLTFLAGETEQRFTVPVLNDHAAAGNLTVTLNLSNLPPGYVPTAQLSTVLTIEDTESVLAYSSPTYSVTRTESAATITVVRTGPPTDTLTVDYATSDGTALSGVDYTPASGTLSFGAGVTEQSFVVAILTNVVAAETRTVQLSLTNVTGSAVLGKQSNAVLSIVNEIVQFYSLNITPPAGGTVVPGSGQYPADSTQVITATPDRDYLFTGWEGSTNTTANPLVLVMNQNYNLTALFVPTKVTYTFEPPFKTADLESAPWNNSETAPWLLESGTAAAGQYALRSGPIGNSQESVLEAVFDTRAGAVSFMLRVSSEANWDFLEFYLNGVRLQRWSGNVAWQRFQFNVGTGLNRLTWRYVKDANFSIGADAAFIDDLYVPLNVPDPTPIAAVLSVAGVANNVVSIRLDGRFGVTYVLEAGPDFGTWTPIGTNTLQGTSTVFSDPMSAQPGARFYRAVAP